MTRNSKAPNGLEAKDVICAAFTERRKIGEPFYIRDLCHDTGYGKSIVSRLIQPIVTSTADELLKSVVSSDVESERWRNDFKCLRAFLSASRKIDLLVQIWMSLHIELLVLRGEKVRHASVRSICGGTYPQIQKALAHWTETTGQRTHTYAFVRGSGRGLVMDAFVARHKLGVPFNQKDVANDVGCSGPLVSAYTKDYVKEVADRLLEEVVSTDSDFDKWRAEFVTLRAFLYNTARRNELTHKWVLVHIEFIYRAGRLPTHTEVFKLCGSGDVRIRQALKAWSEKIGVPLQHAQVWKVVSIADLLDRVDGALHKLPLTFLESPELGEEFSVKQRRMVSNIRSQTLRNTAFFVMAFADRNRANDLNFFTQLNAMMASSGISDYSSIEANSFYENYHKGQIFPDHSDGKKSLFLQTLFRLLRRQDDYLRKLTSTQRILVSPFLLRGPEDGHFWRESKLNGTVAEKRTSRRKLDVAVVHSKFYLLRDIAERRLQMVDRLHKAYLQAIESAKSGARLPLSILLEEEIYTPSQPLRHETFRFQLWDGAQLRSIHEQHGGLNYYDDRDDPNHPSNWKDCYYLTYEISETHENSRRYWFSDLLRAGLLPGDEDLERLGMARHNFNVLPRSTVPQPVRGWLLAIRNAVPNIEFVPIDLCMSSALIGNAAVQIMTKTGARMNEFLQIRLERKHLIRADLSTGAQVIAFHAIPKGRNQEEPFYIDESCMQALFAWWTYRRSIGYPFESVEATKVLQHKIKPAPYLWQIDQRHLKHNEINASMEFLLLDVPLERVDGSRVRLTSHLLRHSFATEMRALDTPIDVLALLLKQRDTSVTEYYSKPTPPMLAEYQRRIFEIRVDLTRTHVRSAGQISAQIEDAMAKVGALAPVVGGTCTVANSCPAAYACLGCFGNAPDPSKRGQVAEYKQKYLDFAHVAEDQGLPHEKRKALEIVSNCNDMLAEMDCIDASRLSASRVINVSLVDSDGKSI